jgi:hypothetical protein
MEGCGIMLANFEKRVFNEGEGVWIERYKNLRNILHWHFQRTPLDTYHTLSLIYQFLK